MLLNAFFAVRILFSISLLHLASCDITLPRYVKALDCFTLFPSIVTLLFGGSAFFMPLLLQSSLY